VSTNDEASPAWHQRLERYARVGLWALPIWAILLLIATWERQPDPTTNFPQYAEFTTTMWFLISHIIASIVGAAIGVIGLVALFFVLSQYKGIRLAVVALVAAVLGNVLVTSVFGVAAFAQPAIGRAYLDGSTTEAVAFESDVYGPALFATALPGILFLTIGIVLFGLAVARSGQLPKYAGYAFAISGVLFAFIGFAIGEIQTLGAVLMILSTVWIAWVYRARKTITVEKQSIEPDALAAG
jgi:hypothetical protein